MDGPDDRPGRTAAADAEAIRRVLAGDREAFTELVDRHQGRIRGLCTRLAGAAGEDLAQECFVRAWQALDRFDHRHPFRGWLLVIASRLCANHAARRREARLGTGDGGAWEPAATGCDPAQAVAEAEAEADLRRRLERALAGLPVDARSLYELRFRQQLDPAELAAHLGISEAAVKVRVTRLRQSLAAALGIPWKDRHER